MTLEELSETYREAAKPLRERLQQLRMELVTETDPLNAYSLKTRIAHPHPAQRAGGADGALLRKGVLAQ